MKGDEAPREKRRGGLHGRQRVFLPWRLTGMHRHLAGLHSCGSVSWRPHFDLDSNLVTFSAISFFSSSSRGRPRTSSLFLIEFSIRPSRVRGAEEEEDERVDSPMDFFFGAGVARGVDGVDASLMPSRAFENSGFTSSSRQTNPPKPSGFFLQSSFCAEPGAVSSP